MSRTRIIISGSEITDKGILITEMNIIDSISGEILKVCKFTPELLSFLNSVEIDVEHYFNIQSLKEKNKHVSQLINTFKLYS